MSNYTKYELAKDRKETLDAIINTLLEFCRIHELPMFVSVAYANNDKKTKYLNEVYAPSSNGIKLFDDQIRKNMLIANGFEAVEKRSAPQMNMASLLEDDDDV